MSRAGLGNWSVTSLCSLADLLPSTPFQRRITRDFPKVPPLRGPRCKSGLCRARLAVGAAAHGGPARPGQSRRLALSRRPREQLRLCRPGAHPPCGLTHESHKSLCCRLRQHNCRKQCLLFRCQDHMEAPERLGLAHNIYLVLSRWKKITYEETLCEPKRTTQIQK